jgi:23S rRNA (adenine2030-N6)-methyltransferase
MKYRHSFHAGNFADVHKHVTLLALLSALKRKDKGFLYLETHAGRGAYDLSSPSAEASAGVLRFESAARTEPSSGSEELRSYLALLDRLRQERQRPHLYPGSPLIAAHELRPQDRGVLVELLASEARVLEENALGERIRVERGYGFERLRAWLPPPERRGLTFIDPPYEETRADFDRVTNAVAQALQRFHTGVIAVWYPIKDEREIAAWRTRLGAHIDGETLTGELWLYPRDSRVALNGSGMLIVNPPYLLRERMQVWLPELHRRLDPANQGGARVT